ncbi:MAG: protein translocase subunit SecF [Rhodospirillaceae bacterium]|nr:protein translocase subunit SecF [Rhodospirillaceae bacterium]
MRPIHFVPASLKVNFLGARRIAYVFSALLLMGSLAALAVEGLNFGIDFRGGILIEIETDGPADVAGMRAELGTLGLGEITLQEFGGPNDVLIRIQRQEGDEASQAAAIQAVQAVLGEGVDYRRTEFVGPTVGEELIEAGTLAVVLAMAGILIYVWFRFEWQFGLCAVVALVHDVISTVGLFSVIQHEFNLSTVAALLTIAGYSINDTVVVFDRVRENLRRYRRATLIEVLNRSLNETLSRTILTSFTTLLAVLALYIFGGAVIRDFAFAMMWGILIGTYSSIFVAVPLLLSLDLNRPSAKRAPKADPGHAGKDRAGTAAADAG